MPLRWTGFSGLAASVLPLIVEAEKSRDADSYQQTMVSDNLTATVRMCHSTALAPCDELAGN